MESLGGKLIQVNAWSSRLVLGSNAASGMRDTVVQLSLQVEGEDGVSKPVVVELSQQVAKRLLSTLKESQHS
jgi:hypothetical protein